ncbi:Acetyltransferase (GNAT) family [uncultured Clostridium sp.]|uniref:GNAT family N-acetyltransferase n=1 Tax=uncultured Clostridium sp. TaxID=59620 RepID=UPI0008206E09|nr:GNAT family N-acetyltransferase [uncultured Clostridium sp.]SCK03078.1 Acetyltransferase (GNAT) family [uncultured Clostridium sp.]
MYKKIKIKDTYGKVIEVEIVTLSNEYLNKIIELQDRIFDSLENKSFFAKTEKFEFEDIINKSGEVIGVVSENDKLIAFGAMVKPELQDFNLGYDLNFDNKKLMKIAHIESTVVHPAYRGNRLQKLLVQNLEEIAKEKECNIFCATVAPKNKFSLNTLLKLEYKIVLEKEKYGGLKRYIMIKET